MNERLFKGLRTKNGALVTYRDTPLDLRLDLKEHSPMGFEWGYNGSGPKQLALAILAEVNDDKFALFAYENFCTKFIESITKDEWSLDYDEIRKWTTNFGFIHFKPILTSGFKIIEKNSTYNIFYNEERLGQALNIEDNNTGFENNICYVYATFDEVSHLKIHELPQKLKFDTLGTDYEGYDKGHIDDIFNWFSFKNNDGLLIIEFSLYLYLAEYDGYLSSKILINNFINQLSKMFIEVEVHMNDIEGEAHICNFSISMRDNENTLSVIFSNIIGVVIDTYDKELYVSTESNTFEATFNLPEEYQSILKPYMLYFEEFLHDLCIDSDVNIRKEGKDTILSVEPKNKDEALEKIANALKMYLSAPIVASNVGLEQKLQMQVALQKLHAECSHMESQLVLKTATLNINNEQLIMQNEIISETKRILVEAGVKPEIITKNNTILLESLKEIRFDNQNIKKKTFFESFKGKLKVAGLFDTSIEINMKQLENKHKDTK